MHCLDLIVSILPNPIFLFVSFGHIFSRPGVGVAHLQTCLWLGHSLSHLLSAPLPPLALRSHLAQTVWNGASSQKCIIGSQVLLNRWILPIWGVVAGRVFNQCNGATPSSISSSSLSSLLSQHLFYFSMSMSFLGAKICVLDLVQTLSVLARVTL